MIYFDLDDTLIDTHYRHYKVLEDFLKKYYSNLINDFIKFENYIKLRRKYVFSNWQILDFLFSEKINKSEFSNFFLENIESTEYLKFDKLIIDTELLIFLKANHKLGICSLRSNHENANKQLKKLSLNQYFDDISFLKHSETNPKTDFFKSKSNAVLFFGDSQTDYESTINSNIDFIGVDTGFYTFTPTKKFSNINEAIYSIIKH